MAAAQKPRVFDPVGGLPPSAGTASEASPAEETKPTSRRREAKTSRRQDVKTPDKRLAYTWRITREQNDQLDRLAIAVRDEAGRLKLDRSELLAVLLDYAAEGRADVIADLAQRLDAETS